MPKNVMSFLVQDLIREVHGSLEESVLPSLKVKTHDVHGVAEPLCIISNLSLPDVLRAAT